jgi:hypothetical protein
MCEKAAKENDLKTQYNLIRSPKRSNYIRNREVRDKQGNKLKADKEILNRWKELFEEIYAQQEINQGVNDENNIEILNIDTEKIGKDEIRAALKRMKDGRAPRGDNIPTELLKADTEQTVEILQRLSNMIWGKEEIPNEWKEGVIIKIPKKRSSHQVRQLESNNITTHSINRNSKNTTRNNQTRDMEKSSRIPSKMLHDRPHNAN